MIKINRKNTHTSDRQIKYSNISIDNDSVKIKLSTPHILNIGGKISFKKIYNNNIICEYITCVKDMVIDIIDGEKKDYTIIIDTIPNIQTYIISGNKSFTKKRFIKFKDNHYITPQDIDKYNQYNTEKFNIKLNNEEIISNIEVYDFEDNITLSKDGNISNVLLNGFSCEVNDNNLSIDEQILLPCNSYYFESQGECVLYDNIFLYEKQQ